MSSVAATPSSWRPPWLETITPAAPCSTASAASSPVWTPLTRTGSEQSAASAPRSSQSSVGSTSSNSSVVVIGAPAADRRRDRRTVTSGRDGEARAQVALAPARARRVDGEHDRLEAGLDRLVDERPGHAAVA